MDRIVCFYIAGCNEWQRKSGGGSSVKKKYIIGIVCTLGLILLLLGMGFIDTSNSSGGEYSHWYYEEGRVKSVNGKSVVVAFDKNEEKETFFKDEDTIELDCKSCNENTVNLLEEGMKIQFSFFKYSVDVQPLEVEQIQICGTVKEKEEETVTVCIDTNREIVCNWPEHFEKSSIKVGDKVWLWYENGIQETFPEIIKY